MTVWTKRISAKLEEQWRNRLFWLPDDRVVVTANPASPQMVQLQVFDVGAEDFAALVKDYGGKVTELRQEDWFSADQGARQPLRVKDRLLIVNSEASQQTARTEFPERDVIFIPPGMAFGTGEHATTITALRRLVECAAASRKAGAAWTCCDAGTGSGLLAIAAEKLGAARIDAFDFDETAVQVAEENAAANDCPRTRYFQQDILDWSPPAGGYSVVLANIYHDVLIKAMPVLRRAVAPGGTLILSGILRTQAEAVWTAGRTTGLQQVSQRCVGKWVTGVWTLPGA